MYSPQVDAICVSKQAREYVTALNLSALIDEAWYFSEENAECVLMSLRTIMGVRNGGRDCYGRISNFQAIEFFIITILKQEMKT